MLPSIFGENLFDDFFDDSFEKNFFGERNPLYGKHAKNLMKTDVKEKKDGYELAIDLPGFKKEDVSVELKDGYLTVCAAKGLDLSLIHISIRLSSKCRRIPSSAPRTLLSYRTPSSSKVKPPKSWGSI